MGLQSQAITSWEVPLHGSYQHASEGRMVEALG